MRDIYFQGWDGIWRTVLVGFVAYGSLIIVLRLSGKRTLSKWNMFDFVVTIALGSTLSSILISKNTALAEGMTAFILLVGLQFVITWLSVRWNWFSNLVKSRPTLLLKDGVMLTGELKRCRVNESEIMAAIRQRGLGSLTQVTAVVLETDGSFSVISYEQIADAGVLNDVRSAEGNTADGS